eukprot:7874359-Pyramimonas_sp.AAC.1
MHAIVDIEKCFDRVPWRELAKACRDHSFPARLFILALRMYSAPRRLAWDGCNAVPIWASQGVLPGCPFAMFCLQCVMLTPFDELFNRTECISRSLDIYADDITITITGPASHIVSAACVLLRMVARGLVQLGLPPARHKMTITSLSLIHI